MQSHNLPTPLVSIDWLVDHLDDPDLILLDATIGKIGLGLKEEFASKWIKNSLYFDLEGAFSDHSTHLPHMLTAPEAFTKEAHKLGIKSTSKLVIYDKWGIYSSPRVWWMFRAMGHSEVAVLDGGLPLWEHAGLPLQAAASSPQQTGDFVAKPNARLIKNSKDVLAIVENPTHQIVDARPAGRFAGTSPEPRAHLRGGHMPTAKNLPSDRVLEGTMMLESEKLKALFKPLAPLDQPFVFSCGSGVTACILDLAAHVAGYENTAVYDGSWSEWGEPGPLPVTS